MTLQDINRFQIDKHDSIAIDGVAAQRVCRPADAQAVADLLRQASEDDCSVCPVGSGLHQRVGRAPGRVDVAVSTLGLAGIVRYDPEDLVVSVAAGTTLADLQAELATHGQWLPVESPGGSRATVGGMLALGLTGPRQLGSLSMRDLLLGMSVALTDGTVARSGGMVVKNVTGFDMGRLHVGARGTLGIITSANFKVLPRPETEATLLVQFSPERAGIASAFAASDRLRAGSLRPVAIEITIESASVELAVRFEGRSGAVQRQVRGAGEDLEGDQTTIADPVHAQAWWTRHVERLGFSAADQTVLRLDARPREIGGLAGTVAEALRRIDVSGWRVVASPGMGLAWVQLGTAPRSAVSGLLEDLGNGPAAITVMSAPIGWKNELRSGNSANLVARPIDVALRKQFDPHQILNRGRFPIV